MGTPAGAPDRWERYPQKPIGGFITSTEIGGASSVLATLETGTTDLQGGVTPPVAVFRLRAAPDARVFEIDGPEAWRRLCPRYPDIDEDGRLVPDWAGVAADCDSVHLSLGGFLTAEQVRVDGPEGWTEHRFWEFEQTVWLRWVSIEVEEVGELAEYPSSPVDLGWPEALRFDDEKPWRRTLRLDPGAGADRQWPAPAPAPTP